MIADKEENIQAVLQIANGSGNFPIRWVVLPLSQRG